MSPTSPGLTAFCDAVPHLLVSLGADGHEDFANRRWFDFTGSDPGEGRDWVGQIHEDDRKRLEGLVHGAVARHEPFRTECRLRGRNGALSWFLAQADSLQDAEGVPIRWLITFTEIEPWKGSEQVYMTLANELGHRVKNIFAIFSSLVRLSVAKHPSAADFAVELEARVGALALASELAVPVTNGSSAAPATIPALIEQLLTPYRATQRDRISVDLENLPIGLTGANALALVIHEQATNAVKYGALSTASGDLLVQGRRRDDLYIVTWKENGGPRLDEAPQHRGFGSRLTDQTVSRQLAGRIARRWTPEGLSMEMHLPIERLQS
jgi:two-component sensor histidine kinase